MDLRVTIGICDYCTYRILCKTNDISTGYAFAGQMIHTPKQTNIVEVRPSSQPACTMEAFPCFTITSTVDPTKNTSPQSFEIPLCLVLAMGLSIFAVVGGISPSNFHFKPPIHHMMAKCGTIENASLFGDTQRPSVPLNHIHHSCWSTAPQMRC